MDNHDIDNLFLALNNFKRVNINFDYYRDMCENQDFLINMNKCLAYIYLNCTNRDCIQISNSDSSWDVIWSDNIAIRDIQKYLNLKAFW